MRLLPRWPVIAATGAFLMAGCQGRSLDIRLTIPMEDGATSLASHRGVIWAGTAGKGLARIGNEGEVAYFGERAGLGGRLAKIRWIAPQGEDIWLATDGGAARFSPDSGRLTGSWKEEDGLASSRVRWIGAADGRIWAGSIRGASRREKSGKWRSYGSSAGLPSVHVYRMHYSQGVLYAACINGGLARFVPRSDRFREVERKRGMGNKYIYALGAGKDGLWLGTAAGMDFYRPGQGGWDEDIGREGFTDYSVYALAQSGDTLWFGTAYGLYRRSLSDGGQSVYGVSAGLPSDEVTALLALDGTLWVATTAGIVLINEASP